MREDLVQQLRDLAPSLGQYSTARSITIEAADRIDTLEAALRQILATSGLEGHERCREIARQALDGNTSSGG